VQGLRFELEYPVAGKIKQLIDELIRLRTRSNVKAEPFVRVHLVLNGIDPDVYSATSPDDPEKIRVLRDMIRDFERR
jgi:hypothetical protein